MLCMIRYKALFSRRLPMRKLDEASHNSALMRAWPAARRLRKIVRFRACKTREDVLQCVHASTYRRLALRAAGTGGVWQFNIHTRANYCR